jgi:hypothetical protein
MLAGRLFVTFAALVLAVPAWAQTSSNDGSERNKSAPSIAPSKPSDPDNMPGAPIMTKPSIMGKPESSSSSAAGRDQVPIRLYGRTYVGKNMPIDPYRDNNPYKANPYRDNNPYTANPYRDNNPYGKGP